MFRRISLAAAIAAVLSPVGVHALGLGDIHLRSYLNQTLDAEIDLLSVKKNEVDGVKVELASSQAFENAGIERPYHLTKLVFTPEVRTDGRTVIRVSSKAPMREPFLNFLVEVNWPKGRLLREYTVLIDPPVSGQDRPQMSYQAPAAVQPAVAVQPVAPTPRSAAPAPSYTSYSGAAASSDRIRQTADGIEYGPVQRNETLWSIANIMRPAGASAQQVAISLLHNNPEAFQNGDVNLLRKGSVLRLPNAARVTELAHAEAVREFRSRLAQAPAPAAVATRSERAKAPDEAKLTLLSADSKKSTGTSPTDQAPVAPGAPEGLDELRKEVMILRESAEARRQEEEDLRARVKELEDQLFDLKKLLVLKDDQLAELQAAAGQAAAPTAEPTAPAAEEPIPAVAEDTQPSVIEPMPGAEAPVEPSAQPEAPAAETPAEPAVAEQPMEPAPTGSELEPPVVEPQEPTVTDTQPPVVEPTVAETPEPVVEPVPAEAPIVEPEPVPSVEPTVAETQPLEPSQEPPADTAPVAKPEGMLDKLTKDPKVLGAGAGALALIGGLLWMSNRRRRKAEEEMEESILIGAGGASMRDTDSEDTVLSNVSDETSFLSDFSASDIASLQDDSTEVDPVAEADVYIAYGRYQQAEELLEKAIEARPDRIELQQKLLEIQSAGRNKEGFAKTASAMLLAGVDKDSPEVWERVSAMGRELLPNDPMFQERERPDLSLVGDEDMVPELPDEPEEIVLGGEDEMMSFDLGSADGETDEDDAFSAGNVAQEDEDTAFNLDFDVDELKDALNESEADEAAASGLGRLGAVAGGVAAAAGLAKSGSDLASSEEDEEGFSFDLDGLGLDEETDEASTEEPSITLDVGDLELDKSLADTAAQIDEVTDSLEPDALDEINLNMDDLKLDDISLEGLGLGEGDETVSTDLGETEIDLSDIDFDELSEGDSEGLTITDDMMAQVSSADEVATKLDLARAYVDMGDSDGARNILGEVLKEGDSEQISEANEILRGLDA